MPESLSLPPDEILAKAMTDDYGKPFVRLYRGTESGTEFHGLCEANGDYEAELIAKCLNAIVNDDLFDDARSSLYGVFKAST